MSSTYTAVLSSWKWRQHTAHDDWHACAHSKPTTEIFTDLLDAKLIPDPFLDENEKVVQWVGEADWEYACEFFYEPRDGHARQDLVFDGLDTVASVFLNDGLILESTNMFQTHRVNVSAKLQVGLNRLRIVFLSALKWGQALEASKGHYRAFNGDHSRTHVRKAQYHYGWDWGPILLTCGPYREIKLESYASTFTDVFVDAQISDDLQQGDLNVSFNAILNQNVIVDVKVTSPSSIVIDAVATLAAADTHGLVSLMIPKPELWYPCGYGPQLFYTVDIDIRANDGTILKSTTKRIGMRRARLIQRPLIDEPGTSFFFEVNNHPVYCSGSNWIPGHSFLTAMSPADYTAAIEAVVEGNQNMLRVWGGGIYEPDVFYEECDRLGVLVWQDFMFACSNYPCYAEFGASVEKEAADQVKRLRNYCSIVVYAGNNEDYSVAEMLKLDWEMDDHSGDWTNTNFPARTIYETYLPEAVAKHSPGVPYHFGSPWGGKDTEDPTIGDIHQWNVWHGKQEKYQLWDKLVGRFVSEFGMLAFPSAKSIRKFVSDPRQLYPQSSVLDHHNKADGSERRLALYVMENLRVNAMDLDSWIYATQLVQAECLAFAYRSCRRGWRGPDKEYCGGVLVWQVRLPCSSPLDGC
jgi:beta-mannosidase